MYTEYQPSHLLVPYIDSYWEFKGNPDYGMRIHILPDGCTDFIFTLGEVANAVEEGSLIMQPYRSYFVGPMTKYSELVTYTESIHMFGVRFLPCGLSCFTNLPLHEGVNSRVSTNEMKAVFDDTCMEKLVEQIKAQYALFAENAEAQVSKNNKAAGTRARKAALEIMKLMKEFRKISVEAAK